MINRYLSSTTRLETNLLNDKVENARSYDRIDGYCSSSVLEGAGEAIENIQGKLRLVCN